MYVLLFLFLFNIFYLFLNQNILNLVAFYCLYILLVKFYQQIWSYESELEQNLWVELIRILMLIRAWSFCLVRYNEYQLFKLTKSIFFFYKNLKILLSSQKYNIYKNYRFSVVQNIKVINTRLLENELYFNTYMLQIKNPSFLVSYI